MSITVRVNHKETGYVDFDIPTEWEDMTLSYWTGMLSVIKDHTQKKDLKTKSLEETYKDSEFLENILNDVEILDEMSLNADIFCYVSGLNRDDTKKADMKDITKVINAMEVLTEEYEPKGTRSFEYEGETYYFPSEFLRKNTYGDFIEATQLEMTIESMKNGRFDVLPEQMAILCRRVGEEYDEDKVQEKTEKFKNLTMDIVFEFAFFLTNQNQNLLKLSSMYLEKEENL